MQRLRIWLHRIKIYLFRARKTRPEDIPKLLDNETLAKAMAEARFLFSGHAVDVRELDPGEEAGMPKAAGEEPPMPVTAPGQQEARAAQERAQTEAASSE